MNPMGLRFYRRVKILPGLSVNVSKSGPSLSVGVRGAHVTFSRRTLLPFLRRNRPTVRMRRRVSARQVVAERTARRIHAEYAVHHADRYAPERRREGFVTDRDLKAESSHCIEDAHLLPVP